MIVRRVILPLALVLAGGSVAAQDYGYGQGGYGQSGYGQGGYAPGFAQPAYDTDGQSVDSVAVFVEPLSRYGRWLNTRYGRVWSPNIRRDWRPYTIGHWEEGAYGQTWRSDEPFGWAVFHFGRWAFDRQLGWLWSPDTVWGPGWVAWRDSDDVTGWAPLPPQISFSFAFGSGYGFNDLGYDQWYAPAWSYVPRNYLYSRSLRGAFLPSDRNRDFWEHTRGVTRYDRVDGQVVNRSFGFGGRDGRDGRNVNRDDRRDWRGGDPRRDGGPDGRDQRRDTGRTDPRAAPLYSTPQRQVPPPANYGAPRDDARGRGYGRDGFIPRDGSGPRNGAVPGVPPRTIERNPAASAPVSPAYRQAPPQAAPPQAAPPVRQQPAFVAPSQPMATPAPAYSPRAEPRPEPRAEPRQSPRERNPDARPD